MSAKSSPSQPYQPYRLPDSHAQSSSYAAGSSASTATSTFRPSSARRRYTSHPGCVLCSIVGATADAQAGPDESMHDARSPSPTATTSFLASSPASATIPIAGATGSESPRAGPSQLPAGTRQVAGKDVVYSDEEITVYRARGKERLTAEGKHLIVVMNRHVESVYDLGPSDVPVLSRMLDTARQVLSFQHGAQASEAERGKSPDIRVGFVGSMIRDSALPHRHLHAHAMAGPVDSSAPGAGFYRRNVVFGHLNWWSIDDLRAEIREESSNNRVKSGYKDRVRPPIERVPDAGSKTGLPNALDLTDDPYAESIPSPSSARLHPDDAKDGRNARYTDRKGKGSTVPRRPAGSIALNERIMSFSSNGSENGDEEGYVAVNLDDGTSRK